MAAVYYILRHHFLFLLKPYNAYDARDKGIYYVCFQFYPCPCI